MDNSDKVQNYAELSRLSTQKLEEILRNDLASPEDDSGNMANYIMEVIEKREKDVLESEAAAQRAWQEFQEMYNISEGKGKSLYPMEKGTRASRDVMALRTVPHKRRRLRRTLLVAAVIVIIIVFLVPAALGYEGFREMIGQWTDTVFRFSEVNNYDPTHHENNIDSSQSRDPQNYASLQAALADYNISEVLIPEQVPEGFTLQNVDVFERPEWGKIEFLAYYQKNADILTISVISRDEPNSSIYEKNDMDVEQYTVNGIIFYLFDNVDQKVAAWYTDQYECSIYGDISIDELKRMIDSIEEG